MIFTLVLLIVFGIAAFACKLLASQAHDLRLIARPGEHREHLHPTPVVGGLAIYLGLLAGLVLVDATYAWWMPSLFLLCVLGTLDDAYELPSWLRFLGQGLAVYLMIELTGIQLHSLGYLTEPGEELVLGRWSIPITIFAAVGLINAVNMSDGHDGLAGSLTVLVLSVMLLVEGVKTYFNLIAIMACLGFLIWNVRVGRASAAIFLGDAGSMMLGLLLAFLLIDLSQGVGVPGIWPVTALWIIALPLIDAVAVLIARPIRGRSPFAADRHHYHHKLIGMGMTVNAVVVVSLSLQMILAMLGIYFYRVGVAEHIQLLLFLMVFFCYLFVLIFTMPKSSSRRSPDK